MVRSNVTELRIRTLLLAGLFAVGLLANTGIPVLAGNSGASKGSGTWTKTGSMNTARDFHTATLLQNGEVLVAGGIGTSDRLTSAELYDPAHGKWRATGNMNHARDGHTGTLLNNEAICFNPSYSRRDPSSGVPFKYAIRAAYRRLCFFSMSCFRGFSSSSGAVFCEISQ